MGRLRNQGDQAGFGLLEVIISFTILSIAGIGLFYVASLSTTGTTASRDLAAATALATARMEELRNTPFDDLASGSDGPFTPQGTAGSVYSRQWTVSAQTLGGIDARDVTVTVTWSATRSLSLRTLIADPPETVVNGETSFVQGWNQVQ